MRLPSPVPALVLVTFFSARAGGAELKITVDALVKPAVDGEWIPGLAVGVVDASGATRVWGWGRTALGGTARAPDGNTLFEIGSASKVFTSLLLADLVERKLVSLDDPIAKFLPATVKVPSFNGHPITLAHLSTHTSGLPPMMTNFAPKDPANPYADYTVEQLYAFLSSYTLSREPGEKYEYSNAGAGLLGHLVALVEKRSYEQALADVIVKPLALSSTRITLTAADRARFAEPHADGAAVSPWDLGVLPGAGGIRSTVNDLLRFLRANLGLVSSPLAPAMALQRARRHDAQGGGIGLAWHLRDDGRTVWHNGQTGGFHSYLAFDPEKKLAVVVLANSNSPLVDGIGYGILRALRGESPTPLAVRPRVRPAFALTAAELDGFAGTYQLAPAFALEVRRDGDHLTGQATGQPAFPLYAESATHFYLRVTPAEIDFHRDASGAVTELVLHQNGHDLTGNKKARP